tara:strand:+ start:271 stop:795 length:525 start_codon:yes stop_codon:yes gene_type:complete
MDKYIYIKRKVFDKDQCKGLIDLFEKSESEENPRGYSGVYTTFNTPSTFFMKSIIEKSIKEYNNKHDFLKRLYTRWNLTPEFNIQKYLPGMAYRGEHMEHGKDYWDSKRLLGWMIYLNDVRNKGGTRWPQQNFTSRPRVGDLYIWPASWTHSHYGIAAPKEIKYIVTGWAGMDP